MINQKVFPVFLTFLLAITLVSCSGVKINSKVIVQERDDYTLTSETGTYTYRIVLEPRTGLFSGTDLGTTTNKSKLVVYRGDFPIEAPVVLPGQPPHKVKETKVGTFDLKPGAKYLEENSPDGGKTNFIIEIDITTDTEKDIEQKRTLIYLVDFRVRKQT